MELSSFVRIFILIFGILPAVAFCQDLKQDTSFLANAIDHANEIHTKATMGEGALFNGVEYKALNLHNYDDGQPYFLSDDWIDGTITYDGATYYEIPMQLDLITDRVIIDHPISHFRLELISEKVKSFELQGHKMVMLSPDSTKSSIKPGFYELLYNGKIKAYSKHKKEKQDRLDGGQIKFEFHERTQYYILKDNVYHQVRSKASVLKVFYERKVMLRKYLKKNRVDFIHNPASAIAQSAKFYEESQNQP
jgi:hypothetical protein